MLNVGHPAAHPGLLLISPGKSWIRLSANAGEKAAPPTSASAVEECFSAVTAGELLHYFIFMIFLMKAEALEKDGEAFQ